MSISGPTSMPSLARIADADAGVDLLRACGISVVVDALMDDEAAQRGAALAGRAHRGEGDAAQREVEIGGGRDDGGVVAAEFQDGAAEAGRDVGADLPAHGGGAGGRDQGDAVIVDQRLADLAAADQDLATVPPARRRTLRGGALDDGLHGERRERRLLRGLPDDGLPHTKASAAFQDQTATGKLKAVMTPHDAERVPGLHHAVVGPLGGDGQAEELARQADGDSRRCRSSPGLRRGPRTRSCRPRG